MNLFFSRCGMKDLIPSTNYPWSDFTYLLISWFYDHLKVKLVKIELNFWKGPYPLISHIWVKLFQFLYIFSDSVEKVDWYQHLTSILASTNCTFFGMKMSLLSLFTINFTHIWISIDDYIHKISFWTIEVIRGHSRPL